MQVVDASGLTDVAYPVVADPAISVTYTKYVAVNVKKSYNWTKAAKQIGYCEIRSGAAGGTCQIANSYSVSASIQTSLGATVGEVSSSIGFNASATASGTITWRSGRAPVGSRYKAWAVGARATYQLQKWTGHTVLGQSRVTWQLTSTSGALTSFSPIVGFSVGQ